MNLKENLEKAAGQKNEGEQQDKPPRYVIRNAAYVLQPQEPLEWLIRDLITKGSVSVFYGEGGSKKTYSLLSLAVCVALGKTWLNFDVIPCKVLFIDEESGERRLRLRLAAAIRGALGDESTQVEYVSLAGFKLDDKKDVQEVEELIKNTGAGLVIIDALAEIMDGDENSKQDTLPIFSALRKIAEITNAAIIVIHHSNRSGGYRGSSAIKGAVDLMIQIESDNDSQYVNFKTEKTRDVEMVTFSAEAVWTDSQFYLSRMEQQKRKKSFSKSQKYVLRYLKEKGDSELQAIMESADSCTPGAAKMAVYSLVDLMMVRRTNPGERGAAAMYDLVEDAGGGDDE